MITIKIIISILLFIIVLINICKVILILMERLNNKVINILPNTIKAIVYITMIILLLALPVTDTLWILIFGCALLVIIVTSIEGNTT